MDLVRGWESSAPLAGYKPLLLVAGVVLVCALCLPAFLSEPARLTSDESLYAAEALNIAAGKGLTYSTGEPIIHRAPLYPALLAAIYEVAGFSLDNAYWLPRLATVVNAPLVLLLARALFGTLPGFVAGLLAAASPYLNGLGSTLFLDGVETTFIVAAAARLLERLPQRQRLAVSDRRRAPRLAVLIKESALLLLPLPLVLPLLAGRLRGWRVGLVAWIAAFAVVAAPWWAWVFWHTHEIFQLGRLASAITQFALAAAALAAVGLAWALSRQPGDASPRPNGVTRGLALALVLVWGAIFIVGLERRSWEHPRDYLNDVPAYMLSVFAPAVQPWLIVALCWLCLVARVLRGDAAAALPLAAGALFLPFLLFFANRELALRDGLPLVYLSYVAVGGGAAWLLAWGERIARDQRESWLLLAGVSAVVVVTAVAVASGAGRLDRQTAASLASDWDNPLATEVAAWLESNLPPGTPAMSTRLYFSHVYFLNGGRLPVHQLPTVLVDVDLAAARPLDRAGSLFRWESHLLPPNSVEDRWLYLTRYSLKGYYVGLTENDLIDELRRREIGYVVLSVTDAGFSSPAFLPYFEASPAFELVYETASTPRDEARIYRVHLDRLAAQTPPMRLTRAAHAALLERLAGDEAALRAALAPANPSGFLVTPE